MDSGHLVKRWPWLSPPWTPSLRAAGCLRIRGHHPARPSAQTRSCTEAPGVGLSPLDSPGEGGLLHPRQADPPRSDPSASPPSPLASVLVILSINLTAHAWSLLSITCLDETQPLARLPSSLQTWREPHDGCVRLCRQGHCGWRVASARPPSPLCTPSLLPESASLQGPSHPSAPHPPDPGVPRNQKPSGERSFTFLFCFLQTRRIPRA